MSRPAPIAIAGIGCRFPGARGPEELWRLLCEGRDAIREVPPSRFDIDRFHDPRPATLGRICTRMGGFLDGVDLFDPAFFGISPREAVRMDPQQRLLLEVAWEALEDAGLVPERLADTPVGVFVGMCYNDYEDLQFGDPASYDIYGVVGGFRSVAAGRVSRALDLRGPSLTVDAACASSLVAVHLACQSLWSGECEVAIACGANLILEPQVSIGFSQARMLAPDGRCKFGDSRADGFVRSEGIGVLVLRRADLAQADGDPGYALILGSASNNDGASGASMMTPGREGQEDLLRRAYRRAGVAPAEVGYVEAHGTGTPAGDPVEIGALAAVLGENRPADRPLRVGSIKTNFGHTEGAAGIAGLIKLALSVERGEIPGSLHVREPNPAIPWGDLPVALQRELTPWPAGPGPRCGGVSSFGINGSNAHVVVGEAPRPAETTLPRPRPAHLLPLSARTPRALAELARSYGDLLCGAGAPEPGDVCAEAALRRAHHEHRLAVVGRDAEELAERLEAFQAGETRSGTTSGVAASGARRGKIAFVFPGQGSQWLGMGRELMRHEPVFLAALEACDREIGEHAGWSLLEELATGEAESRLAEVDVVQPALFAVQVALAALWRSWGVEPDAVVGQSLGEVAAAHVAGALSLADAARVICRRSRLVKSTRGQGGMAVVELSLEEARAALHATGGRVSVAVSSGPRSTVLSGEGEALRAVLERLEARGVFCRPINVDYASHSSQMDPLREELLRCLKELRPGPARVPFYSTVTGAVADGAELGASYWARNLREPVLFTESLRCLLADGHDVFVEVSAHPVLLISLQQAFEHWGETGAVALPSARREEELPTLLGSLGALYTAGGAVDWRRLHPAGGRRVRLPSYPWQHESLWIERSTPGLLPDPARGTAAGGSRTFESAAHPGLRFWEDDLGLREAPWIDGHRVQGALVLPAAAILERALAAGAPAGGGAARAIESVRFEKALFLPEDRSARVQTVVSTDAAPPTVRIFSRDEATASWTLHAAAVLRDLGAEAARPVHPPLEEVRRKCPEEVSGERLYGAFEDSGLRYGGSFRAIERLFLGNGEALAELRPPAAGPFLVHPALLDSCLQSLAFLLGDEPGFWPVSVESLRLYRSPAEGSWCHAVVRARGAEGGEGDVTLLTSGGEPVLSCRGLGFRRLAAGAASSVDSWLHRLEWRPAPPAAPRAHVEGGWTILADAGGLGDALATRLRELGEPCRVVRSVEEMPGARLEGIVDLRGLDRTAGDDARVILDDAVRRCWDATRLLQALAARDLGEPRRLFLVTRGAQPVVGGEAPAPASACLWGLGRVVAYEHPELRCRLIDLEPEGDPWRDLDALVAELRAGGSESQVAWRGGERHVARWTPCPGGKGAGRVTVHGDGGYLITGGLGGLGLAVAGWLVERGTRHLALLGRRGPSEAARDAIARLEAAGAEVLVLRADIADPGEAARALEEIGRRMPPLRGVVHAAGLLDDKTLLQLDEERLRAVLYPKVTGAWNLHRLTAGAPLDLFLLFSSVASLLGSPGQGNYAAANAFLDALAHLRRTQGLPATSIGWGPWSDVGLAAAPDRGERLARRGLGTLTPREALDALEHLLERGDAEAAVAPFDLARWRQFYPAVGDLPLFDLLRSPEPPPAPAPEATESAADPESLTTYLRNLLARVLGQPAARVDLDRPVTKLGIDSLMAVEVRNRIEIDLGVMLSIVSLLRGPTVVQLAEQIFSDLDEQRVEPGPDAPDPSLAAVQGLAEAEVDALLADLLAEEGMAS